MRRLVAVVALSLSGGSGGCNAAWGIEPADSVLETGVEPKDTNVDPCSPEDGVSKACITFEAQPHPAYDITTGAAAQRIDGAGKLKIDIFDKDPADPKVPYTTRVVYPLDGSELKIDSFPVTMPLTVPPGRHWLIVQFEDNKNAVRNGDNYVLAGDFLTIPGRLPSGKYVYPEFTTALGTAPKSKVSLQTMRRVDVDLQADPTLRTTYKDFAVNGDGPIVYVLFDGAFNSSTQYLEFLSTKCLNAAPMSLTPPVLKSGFTTAVTGTHNLVASLEDYDSTNTFPTSGSLLSPSDTAIPQLTIVNTSWTATTSLKFVKVLNPYRAVEKMDDQRCP